MQCYLNAAKMDQKKDNCQINTFKNVKNYKFWQTITSNHDDVLMK